MQVQTNRSNSQVAGGSYNVTQRSIDPGAPVAVKSEYSSLMDTLGDSLGVLEMELACVREKFSPAIQQAARPVTNEKPSGERIGCELTRNLEDAISSVQDFARRLREMREDCVF